MSLPRKKLPIGIQTFAKIRCEGCYSVDKTRHAIQLANEGGYYFLSRPASLWQKPLSGRAQGTL